MINRKKINKRVTRPKKLASQIFCQPREKTVDICNFHKTLQTEIREADRIRMLTYWQHFVKRHVILSYSSSQ